jgi:hypothetical protein
MGTGDDAAMRRLPEHFGQANHRHGVRCDDVGQELTGTDRRELVYIPDHEQSGALRHSREQGSWVPLALRAYTTAAAALGLGKGFAAKLW